MSQPYPIEEHEKDKVEEASEETSEPGVISHRQESFQEEETKEQPVLRRSASVPEQLEPGQKHTVCASAIHAEIPGPQGGRLLDYSTVFNERVQVAIRGITSISIAPIIHESALTPISLRMLAEDLLFGTSDNPRVYPTERAWNHYLNTTVIPVIKTLEQDWIGSEFSGANNPVTSYFFGKNGLMRGSLNPQELRENLQHAQEPDVIAIRTKYSGPAMVITYEGEA